MQLYNFTVQPVSTVTAAVVGQFLGTRQQHVLLVRGSRLELYDVDAEQGRMSQVMSQHAFGNIRSATCFRLTGTTKDHLILGSDSGRIVVLEYNEPLQRFVKVHQETFGRSGNRRIVPGQYLATDPKGRAVMIGAVEKAKLIYILNRDAQAHLTISSPLEAHRVTTLVECIVGVDVGYENPLFASLEMDYAEADADVTGAAAEAAEKMLTYYELDLGLNHVVRRWSEPVDRSAHHLVSIPGGYNQSTQRWDGPSGVLVCMEDFIVYKHQGQPEHCVPIPCRYHPAAKQRRGTMIVASVLHKLKAAFFVLLQTEDGDLFKVTLDHEDEEVQALRIQYFDTVPVAVNLVILRAGFLYVASETGTQQLYSFQTLGDDDAFACVSTSYPDHGVHRNMEIPSFVPHELENLALAWEMEALDPLMDAKVANPLQNDVPQIFAACGRGARSSLKRLRHGLEVSEVVSSELPGVPQAVWSTKLRQSDEYDGYIVLSFVNGTLVLSIGETIEEVVDSGLLTSAPTLAVQQLGAAALLQVHPHGIRHILPNQQVSEWRTPQLEDGASTQIVAATTNERQVVVALDNHEIVYFELDMDGQLNEYQERRDMGADVVALSIAACPEGSQRTPYVAIGCGDQTIRIVSLEPDSTLSQVSLQALTAPPSSLCMCEMLDTSVDRHHLTMFVGIGLTNGVYIRTVLDPATGQLTDTRTRFLGSRPVTLVRVQLQEDTAMVALSSRSWLSYTLHGHMHFTPLLFDALVHVSSFSTELCPDGLLCITGDALRIITVPRLGGELKMESMSISYTPRKMAVHPEDASLLYLVEADHRVLSPIAPERVHAPSPRGVLGLDPAVFGLVHAEAGRWASCVRVVDTRAMKTLWQLELEQDEAAFSVTLVPFSSAGNDLFVVVGTAVGVTHAPQRHRGAYLTTFRLAQDGRALEMVHKTEVDGIPLALHAFHGRLIAGTGTYVRIYDMGTKKLLRKCQSRPFPAQVVTLNVQGARIIVGDMQESVHYVMYKEATNSLTPFADDTLPRYTTCSIMLDYDTVMAGDKFGNVYVLRIDSSASMAADEDPTGLMLQNDRSYLMGAGHRSQLLAHFHVGDIVTSLSLESLVPGGRPVVLYTCMSGTIGALVPFISREDVKLMTMLEMHMRQEDMSLVGRDHLAFRGHYAPVKAVIDGDLCEAYTSLPFEKQAHMAEELDRTPSDIAKKLAQLRETTTGC
ncbi:pre-mRNA-splicing factor rse1 [Malassezia nana]|uniref:Pre-mRNA-splicing factor RSE1 n=1 Tax=Malassezia nana TaxID=180528 RepID=A0AAF0ENN1_9BASI|nr:pre-mRNA-splicing factor rse1 [Malassezia nana]